MFNQILLVFLLTKMRFGYSVKQILIIFSPSVNQNQNDSSYNKLGFSIHAEFQGTKKLDPIQIVIFTDLAARVLIKIKKKPADFKVIKTKIIKPNTHCFPKSSPIQSQMLTSFPKAEHQMNPNFYQFKLATARMK